MLSDSEKDVTMEELVDTGAVPERTLTCQETYESNHFSNRVAYVWIGLMYTASKDQR